MAAVEACDLVARIHRAEGKGVVLQLGIVHLADEYEIDVPVFVGATVVEEGAHLPLLDVCGGLAIFFNVEAGDSHPFSILCS
ncbi:hypothetical protein D3C84_1016960 [compost metagenome]